MSTRARAATGDCAVPPVEFANYLARHVAVIVKEGNRFKKKFPFLLRSTVVIRMESNIQEYVKIGIVV